MAITTTIARGYAARLVIMAVLFTVLGIWGVWDYQVKIPRQQRRTEQRALLEQCRAALATEQAAGQPTAQALEAIRAVEAEMQRTFTAGLARPDEIISLEQLQQRALQRTEELSSSPDGQWLALLAAVRRGLYAERRIPLEDYPVAQAAYEATDEAIVRIGEVTTPAKYDRVMQWAFIACLPFGPYFLWGFFQTRRRVYRLDDDGTLQAPEGTWSREEIADIDMSRWMAKSIAWVVHRDGARIKLDDYKHRNLHLIVGQIAHRIRPQEWALDARPRPAGAGEEGGTSAGEAEAAGAADPPQPSRAAASPSEPG